MEQSDRKKPGRKRVSSPSTLEDAACELFIEQTYAGTTIEDITRRAGVSRNTFFNYFSAKSDVPWSSVDDALIEFAEALACDAEAEFPLASLVDKLVAVCERFGPGRLPLVATQYEVMDAAEELVSSGFSRFARMSHDIEMFLAGRLDERQREYAKPISYALVGAVAGASSTWAKAGTSREPLATYVLRAVTPIRSGFEHALNLNAGVRQGNISSQEQ